jgi:hypothetical protein
VDHVEEWEMLGEYTLFFVAGQVLGVSKKESTGLSCFV